MKTLILVAATVLTVAPSFSQDSAGESCQAAKPATVQSERAPTGADSPEMTLEEMEAFIQQDIQDKLAAFESGEFPHGQEVSDHAQVLDIGDGELVVVFAEFALLISEGRVFGLAMADDDPNGAAQSSSGSDAFCMSISSNTVICTYVWGNKIRIVIIRYNKDGTVTLVYDSGWQEKAMRPGRTPRPGNVDRDASPKEQDMP